MFLVTADYTNLFLPIAVSYYLYICIDVIQYNGTLQILVPCIYVYSVKLKVPPRHAVRKKLTGSDCILILT